MTPVYAEKLGFMVRLTNIRAQKIDDSTFKIFGIVLASVFYENKLGLSRFLEKTFLLADTSIKIVWDILLLTLYNADILFAEQKLTWRSYKSVKTLLTTKQRQIIYQKEFVTAALDLKKVAFVVNIAFLILSWKISIYSIWEVQIVLLVAKKVTVLAKYSDFANIFSKKLAAKLSKRFEIIKHTINLEFNK